MKAFNPSGENAAAIALLIFNDMVDDEDATRYTRLGVETVSEKMAVPPLEDTARTLPVTNPRVVPCAGSEVNGLAVPPKLAGVMANAPNWLPAKALSPAASNISEFGDAGICPAPPESPLELETL